MYIAIITQDIEYATRLISYIRHEKKHIPYSFQLFTSVDHFMQNGQKSTCQMAIIDEQLILQYKQSKAVQFNIPLIVVSESMLSLEKDTVFKFRPASIIFNEIHKRLEQRHMKVKPIGHTQVITVSSFSAGVGKTTVATALAEELIKKGEQVFYLNLEKWLSEDLYKVVTPEQINEANLSKLYYLQQTNKEQALEWINQAPFILSQHSFYTLYPFIHHDDRFNLQAEEAMQLLQLLIDSGQFNSIVVDLETGFDPIEAMLIEKGDINIICTHNSVRMHKKQMQQLEYMTKQLNESLYQKLSSSIYMTQQTEQSKQSMTPQHPNTVYIPRIEEGQNMSHSSVYRVAMQHAIKKMYQQGELVS